MVLSRQLINQQSAEGQSGAVNLRRLGVLSTSHAISWGTGVSSGAVTIEAAAREDYDGEWSPLKTVAFDGIAPKQDVEILDGAYGAIRHRISTVVTDGTVTTHIVGG